jgi:ParB family transcriptional regulator, chromosome partitioning protein
VITSIQDPSVSSSAIAKKTSLTLKIALTRIDNLINDVHNTIEPDQRTETVNFLMSIRFRIHLLIDECIRFKNSQKPRY